MAPPGEGSSDEQRPRAAAGDRSQRDRGGLLGGLGSLGDWIGSVGERLDIARRSVQAFPRLLDILPDRRNTVADRVETCAREFPERPFLLFGEATGGEGTAREGNAGETSAEEPGAGDTRVLTYGELDAAANRVAWWALHLGLRPGQVVALFMENRPEFIVTWAGLAKAGVTTALLNSQVSGRALRHALASAHTDTLVVGSECLERFATTAHDLERPLDVWVAPDAGFEGPLPPGAHDLAADLVQRDAHPPDRSAREEVRCGDDLFYIYTSGTTGLPKAAHFSHMRFFGAGISTALALRLDPEHVHYCALPLYHTAGGAMQVSTVLAAGATLALRRRFSASAFWDDCRRFQATHFQYIGEFCRYLVNQPPRDDDRDHGVRVAIGNGLRPDIWKTFQERFGIERIIEFYGATEGNVFLFNFEGKVGSVGRPAFGRLGARLGNAELARFDVERRELVRDSRGFCVACKPGEVGELIGSVQTSLPTSRFEGYTSKEASSKKLLRDAFKRGDAWFRTGDLLRRDADGWYYFVDRIGDTFRWKGENVSTQEVAEALSAYPGCQMVTVYGVEIPGTDGRAGMAAMQLEPEAGERFDGEALYAFVDQHLPRYAAPVFVRLVQDADVTGTFKLRKLELQRDGFDVARIDDALLLRDDEAKAYVPLTRKLQRRLLSGELRP